MGRPEEELTANTIVEVEFRVADTQYPLAALSERTGCETSLMQVLPRSDGSYTVFKRITGAPPETVLDFTRDFETIEACVIYETANDTVFEFQIGEDEALFVVTLIDAGAIPRQLETAAGVVTIVAEIPTTYPAPDVIEHFRSVYPEMELIAQRQKDYYVPLFRQQELKRVVTEMLTPRQHEVLVAAYAAGYYDWPRGKSGEEMADELDVTPATFCEHIRTAERKLLSLLFH